MTSLESRCQGEISIIQEHIQLVSLTRSFIAIPPQDGQAVMPKFKRNRMIKQIRDCLDMPEYSVLTAVEFYDKLGISTDVSRYILVFIWSIHVFLWQQVLQHLLDSKVKDIRHFPRREPKDAMTNAFNPFIAQILDGSNMDIQAVLNAEAMATYLTKYFAKAEPSRQDKARDESRQVPVVVAKECCTVEEYVDSKIKDEINTREVSIQEACWLNTNLPRIEFSNVPLSTSIAGLLDDMAMIATDVDRLADDSTNVHVCATYIFYCKRPDCLESLCFADFICQYSHRDGMLTTKSVFEIDYYKQGRNVKRQFFRMSQRKTLSFQFNQPRRDKDNCIF